MVCTDEHYRRYSNTKHHRIKLTVDGTRTVRGLDVVNIVFTIINEGSRAQSVYGNYSVAILKVS